MWLGAGVLIFWILVGNVVCVLAHQLLGPWDVATAVMSEEALQEKEYAKRGRKAQQGQVRVNLPEVSLGCCLHEPCSQYCGCPTWLAFCPQQCIFNHAQHRRVRISMLQLGLGWPVITRQNVTVTMMVQ